SSGDGAQKTVDAALRRTAPAMRSGREEQRVLRPRHLAVPECDPPEPGDRDRLAVTSPQLARERPAASVPNVRVDPSASEVRVEPMRTERDAAEDGALRALVDGDDRLGRPPVRHRGRPPSDRPVLTGVDEPRGPGRAAAAHDEPTSA